jgi:hypothetical protein
MFEEKVTKDRLEVVSSNPMENRLVIVSSRLPAVLTDGEDGNVFSWYECISSPWWRELTYTGCDPGL